MRYVSDGVRFIPVVVEGIVNLEIIVIVVLSDVSIIRGIRTATLGQSICMRNGHALCISVNELQYLAASAYA